MWAGQDKGPPVEIHFQHPLKNKKPILAKRWVIPFFRNFSVRLYPNPKITDSKGHKSPCLVNCWLPLFEMLWCEHSQDENRILATCSNRMRLRKISRGQVQEVITHPDRVLPDPHKHTRLIAQKRCSGHLIEVIYVHERGKILVVTVI